MKVPVRTGRAWIPHDWRRTVQVRPWRRSAVVAVTGAWNRDEAANVLAAHLPMIPVDADELDFEPLDTDDDFGLTVDDALTSGHLEDIESARRVSSRLHSPRRVRGARALIAIHVIDPMYPAVYAWRYDRPNEPVYRLSPDGRRHAIAVLRQGYETTRSGHNRPLLTAARYT
jgi:hypothetical protein